MAQRQWRPVFSGKIFMTSSKRGIMQQADVDKDTGNSLQGTLQTVAEGNAHVATNPNQTVL